MHKFQLLFEKMPKSTEPYLCSKQLQGGIRPAANMGGWSQEHSPMQGEIRDAAVDMLVEQQSLADEDQHCSQTPGRHSANQAPQIGIETKTHNRPIGTA